MPIGDEIEYRLAYNTACTACNEITDPEIKHAIMHVLQLINYLNELVTELQLEEDDC